MKKSNSRGESFESKKYLGLVEFSFQMKKKKKKQKGRGKEEKNSKTPNGKTLQITRQRGRYRWRVCVEKQPRQNTITKKGI